MLSLDEAAASGKSIRKWDKGTVIKEEVKEEVTTSINPLTQETGGETSREGGGEGGEEGREEEGREEEVLKEGEWTETENGKEGEEWGEEGVWSVHAHDETGQTYRHHSVTGHTVLCEAETGAENVDGENEKEVGGNGDGEMEEGHWGLEGEGGEGKEEEGEYWNEAEEEWTTHVDVVGDGGEGSGLLSYNVTRETVGIEATEANPSPSLDDAKDEDGEDLATARSRLRSVMRPGENILSQVKWFTYTYTMAFRETFTSLHKFFEPDPNPCTFLYIC